MAQRQPCLSRGAETREAALKGATHILLTHAHGDHASDTLAIAKEHGLPVVGIYDLISHWQEAEGIEGIGFNKGGTVDLNGAKVTMVNASHSSSLGTPDGPAYRGSEAGYMIAGEGHTIYLSGDTDIMADMGWMGEYHQPDIGILSAGGHFTMDMKRAAFAAKKYFDFKTIIPLPLQNLPASGTIRRGPDRGAATGEGNRARGDETNHSVSFGTRERGALPPVICKQMPPPGIFQATRKKSPSSRILVA